MLPHGHIYSAYFVEQRERRPVSAVFLDNPWLRTILFNSFPSFNDTSSLSYVIPGASWFVRSVFQFLQFSFPASSNIEQGRARYDPLKFASISHYLSSLSFSLCCKRYQEVLADICVDTFGTPFRNSSKPSWGRFKY